MATDTDESRQLDARVAQQGWSDRTMVDLLRRFVAANGLTAELVDYLDEVAELENDDG